MNKSRVQSQKSRVRNALLVAACLFLGRGITSAATLRGTVTDPSGLAVAGARVSLLAPLSALDERQTDVRGQFAFENLRGGVYRLAASSPGMATSGTEVDLAEGDTRTVDLHLELSTVEEHVVVSASLGDALATQIGSSVSVVTRREMTERGAQGVFEVLRGVPGVEVNQTGRRGGVTSAFIRGGNSNYDLVMIDGIQVNEFGGGSSFDFSSLPVDGVDRVEVTRGPESALYGSNAVTGVVNIVSQRGEGTPHFSLLAEAGSFKTSRFAAGASGLTRGLNWGVNASRLYSRGVVPNDNYRSQSAFVSLGYRKSERRRADFRFFGNANDAGAPGPFGSDPDQLYDAPIFPGGPTPRQSGLIFRDKQNLFAYQGSYSEQFTPRFRQVVIGSVATNDFFFRSGSGNSFSNNLRGIVNTRSEVAVSSKDFLVAGFEYNREQIRNKFIADSQSNPFLLPRTSLAYFVENRWSPTARWYVIAGLRVDDIRTRELPPDRFGSRPLLPASSVTKINPRLSVVYIAHEGATSGGLGVTRLHGSFGTGIRPPNGFDLAFTNNPRLKPERSVSFDSGVEQRFLSDRAVLDVTYFYNRFEDQIVTLGGALSNLSTFRTDNLANARAHGIEASFRIRPTRSLAISGEYTLLNTSILAVASSSFAQFPFQVGQQLVRRPKNSAAYNVTWRRGRLMLNTNAYVRGPVLDIEPNDGTFACRLGLQCLFTNNGYTHADAGFSYALSRGLEVYGRLNNFLNRKYEESLGFPALHLNFLAGIRLNFPAE